MLVDSIIIIIDSILYIYLCGSHDTIIILFTRTISLTE
jgi:hypothetical protein